MPNASKALIKRARLDSLPSGWRIVPLGYLASTQYGLTITAAEAGNVPMLSMRDLVDGKVLLRDAVRIKLSKQEVETYQLNDGDILFNRTNSASLVGKSAVFKNGEGEPFVFASYLVRVAIDRKEARPDFICLFINSEYGQHRLRALATPGVSQYNINPTNLRNDFLVPLPALKEQDRIVEIASEWELDIGLTEQLIDAKRTLRQGFMQRLLSGTSRIQGFKEPWREWKLGQVFREREELGRHDLPLLSITGELGVIPHAETGRKDSSAEDKSQYKRIAPGDIGYNTMRMWQGVSAISHLDGIVSPAYTVCIPQPQIDARFAAHLFKFPPMVHLFYRYSQGMVSDTLNLKFPNFAQIKVRLPPIEEQKKIAAILSAADREIEGLIDRLRKLVEQKRGLMQKLLTGQIRVKEARNGRS